MNESVLNTLAEVAVTLAGFSGVAVAFRLSGARSWSATELRVLWLLIGDSFAVLFFSLLPLPLALANWSHDAIWGFCSALLASWFIVVDLLALRGEYRDRAARRLITVPVITPILYSVFVVALAMSVALWLGAWNFLVPRGQAVYVLGLMTLLAFAAVEFLFFIGLVAQRDELPITRRPDDAAREKITRLIQTSGRDVTVWEGESHTSRSYLRWMSIHPSTQYHRESNSKTKRKENLMPDQSFRTNVLLRSEQTDDRVSVIENTVPVGWEGPPLHHHDFDETFYILEGELTFQLDDELFTRKQGELAFAPRNSIHTLANLSDNEARYVLVCTPAGFERYFELMAAEQAGIEPPPEAMKPIPETVFVGPRIGERAKEAGSDSR